MARTRVVPRKSVPNTPRLEVENPGRGLNTLVSDNMIDNREASALQNIWFVEAGGVSKRKGYHAVGTGLSVNPRGLGTYTDSSSSKYLLTINGTALNYLKDSFASSSTWASAGGSASFTTAKQTTFTSAGGYAFIWNGTEDGAYFDGTNAVRPGTMPKAKFGLYYKGYHFSSGVDGQLNRIYIAEPLDPTDFTNASGASTLNNSTEVPGATSFTDTAAAPAQFIDIDKNDGDKMMGMATFQDSIILFKERSIHQLTLDSSGVPSVALVTRSIGCVSHKSIENVDNDVFFLSRKGYFVLGNEPNFFNSIRSNELSSRIHDDVKLISEASLTLVSSIFYDYKFHSAVPQGGTTANNLMWSYDRRFLAWSKTAADSLSAESFTTLIDPNNREHLYFGASDEAQVYEMDNNYSDGGTAINSYWTSKAFDLDTPDLQKRWLYVDLLFRTVTGTVTIDLYSDDDALAGTATISGAGSSSGGEMGTMLIGEELFGGDPDDQVVASSVSTTNKPYRIKIGKNSRTMKIKISNSTNNETFTLLGIYFGYYPFSQFKFNAADRLTVS